MAGELVGEDTMNSTRSARSMACAEKRLPESGESSVPGTDRAGAVAGSGATDSWCIVRGSVAADMRRHAPGETDGHWHPGQPKRCTTLTPMPRTAAAERTPWLDARASQRLERRLERALRVARAAGAARLVSVTSAVAQRPLDPSAVAAASRRPGEPWFCLEQPERDGSAVAG